MSKPRMIQSQWMRTGTALALAAALLASVGGAKAADRAPPTADGQQAFEIYRDIIAIRTARGQAKTPRWSPIWWPA